MCSPGGYSRLANGYIVLLLGSWYSSLADKRGRRIILFTAISGMVLTLIWVYLVRTSCLKSSFWTVCKTNIAGLGLFWDRIPPELVWLTFFFRLIGCGPFVVIALYVTIVSDLSTEETRLVRDESDAKAVLKIKSQEPNVVQDLLFQACCWSCGICSSAKVQRCANITPLHVCEIWLDSFEGI